MDDYQLDAGQAVDRDHGLIASLAQVLAIG